METTGARQRRRGFNLIEAAIVLGVIGLIVGGIWVSAAAMMESYKVNKTVEGVFTIARNTQDLISARDAQAIGDNVYVTDTVRAAGGIPGDWVNGTTIKHPFGGAVPIGQSLGAQGELFYVGIQAVNKSVCVNLVTKMTVTAAMMGNRHDASWNRPKAQLAQVWVVNGGSHPALRDFPVSAQTAATVCESSNSIYSYFNYTRVN
jgi:type II secretory pathway pseudopilin PulG